VLQGEILRIESLLRDKVAESDVSSTVEMAEMIVRALVWINLVQPRQDIQSVVSLFLDNDVSPSVALELCEMLNALPEEDKKIGVELVVKGAFSRREMRDPNLILDYFDRPDWQEVVEVWRKSGTREIRHVVRKMGKPSASRGVTPITAPKIMVEKRQDPKAAVKQALPRRLKDQAANVQAALEILAKNPTMPLTATDISAAVERNRRSCGASFPENVVREVLPILEQSGLIRNDGNGAYRHKPNAPNL